VTAARAGAARSSSGLLSIGEVLSALRADFPDITISKIRFLETEGLVMPERTSAGYRKFAAQDVARLRYVLSQQRDHYLPLRVIKDQLDDLDRGLLPSATGASVPARLAVIDNAPTAEHFTLAPAALRLTREELRNAAGLSDAQVRELEQYGLVTARADGHFDDDALAIAQVTAQLGSFGLEGRHLRAFRNAADREIGLFSQVVDPLRRQRGSDARARAEETVRELAALSVRLHAALVQTGLRDSGA
jgi:DNA-binding transcriptional MerR regulator